MKYQRALYWFRRDLRLYDNPALTAASEASEAVIAIYIQAPKQWQAHHLSPAQSDLICRQLHALQQELASYQIPLLVLEGSDYASQLTLLAEVIDHYQIEALFGHREIELNERQRDQQCEQFKVPCHWFDERFFDLA